MIRRTGKCWPSPFWVMGVLLLAFSISGQARTDGGQGNVEGDAKIDQAATAGDYLPFGWRSYYVQEPVLSSTIRVATRGKRGKPPLLLVHGLGQNGLKDWLKIGEAFHEEYYIVAPDLPGFGASSLPSGRLSPENLADLIYWLVKDQGLDRIHLAGHSMGGAVALFYAAKYPQTLRELTIIDAAGVLHRAAFVKSMADLDREVYRFLPEALQRPAAKLLNWSSRLVEEINLLPDLTRPLQRSDLAWNYLLQDQANTNAALSMINTDYSAIVAAIRTPTRIIWGRHDPIAPLRTGHMLRGLIAQSELHIIPNAEHVPIQTHAAEVVDLMRKAIKPVSLQNPSPSSRDLTCRGRTGQEYSGSYRRILLDGCLDIRLVDVVAESVQMTNSAADMIRVRVTGPGRALTMQHSRARLTDVQLAGQVSIELHASRLDLAGVQLAAGEAAIRIGERSVIIASLSEAASPIFEGRLHGAVRAEKVSGEALAQLRSSASPLD